LPTVGVLARWAARVRGLGLAAMRDVRAVRSGVIMGKNGNRKMMVSGKHTLI
jgi:hypothetical protein